MIDFTNLPTRKKAYGGANGNKISVIYNDELYMLKLPMHALIKPNLHILISGPGFHDSIG